MRSILRLINLSVLFLFLSTTTYPSNYYVDKNASVQNNGTSWVNAWQSFSAISWGSINPGDVIYISGGTDSTVYDETLAIQTSGTPGHWVTIRNSYDAGHNGKVIIDRSDTTRNCMSITGNASNTIGDYLYIKGIETRNGVKGMRIAGYCDYVTMDSCIIKYWHPSGEPGGLMINGGNNYPAGENLSNITIKNCTIISLKMYDAAGTDCIYSQGTQTLRLSGNFIHHQNQSTINYHSDCIQLYRTADVWIWNNIIISDSVVMGHTAILGVESRANDQDTMIVYNNYIFSGGHNMSGGNPMGDAGYNRWYEQNYHPLSYWIHNTIVTMHGGKAGIRMEFPASIKNNIVAQYGTNGQDPAVYGGMGLATLWMSPNPACNPPCYVDSCTNNLLWREWGGVAIDGSWYGNGNTGAPSTWSGWVNTYGGTGVGNEDPEFANNVRGRNGYVISSNSPARDKGSNLKSFIESKGLPWTDIDGKPRDSTPDIGAYEYAEEHGNLGSKNYSYTLSQNYPNPFNPTTAIEYYTPQRSRVKLVVYNMIGQGVQTLVDGEKASGLYEVEFNAANLPSGVYFYRLLAANFIETKKMVLLR